MAKQKKTATKARNSKPAPEGLGDGPEGLGAAVEQLMMAVYGQKQQQTAAALLDASSAVEAAAEDLKLHDRRMAAERTDDAAQWLETAAQTVIRMDPKDVTKVLADAADRHPALFIGSAAVGGAALVLWLQTLNRQPASGH